MSSPTAWAARRTRTTPQAMRSPSCSPPRGGGSRHRLSQARPVPAPLPLRARIRAALARHRDALGRSGASGLDRERTAHPLRASRSGKRPAPLGAGRGRRPPPAAAARRFPDHRLVLLVQSLCGDRRSQHPRPSRRRPRRRPCGRPADARLPDRRRFHARDGRLARREAAIPARHEAAARRDPGGGLRPRPVDRALTSSATAAGSSPNTRIGSCATGAAADL